MSCCQLDSVHYSYERERDREREVIHHMSDSFYHSLNTYVYKAFLKNIICEELIIFIWHFSIQECHIALLIKLKSYISFKFWKYDDSTAFHKATFYTLIILVSLFNHIYAYMLEHMYIEFSQYQKKNHHTIDEIIYFWEVPIANDLFKSWQLVASFIIQEHIIENTSGLIYRYSYLYL